MSHYIPNLLLCSALLFSVGFPISTGADEKPEDLASAVRLKNSTIVEGNKERGISALMLDVFLPGWRECVDWKRGEPSTQCVPFPVERPENCTKEIWSKAMADVDQGKLKNCA